MYKNIIIIISTFALLSSQTLPPEITTEKQRLLILSAEADSGMKSVGTEVASILSGVATSLGRFEVIDRNDLGPILEEQSLQLTGIIDDAMVAEVGKIASANEALVVKVLNFYQQGVPPKDKKDDDDDDDLGLFGKIVLTIVKSAVENSIKKKESKSDPYPHNIQTTLSVQVKKINIETGKSLDSFTITSGHTGGNRGRSRAVVMTNFRRQALTKMKHLYTLTSEVISVNGREVLLFLGSEVGVKPGTLFEIVKPDRMKTVRGKEIVLPGKRVGIVEVTDFSTDANRSTILRNWRSIKEGYRALEYTKLPVAFKLGYIQNNDTPYSGLNLGLTLNAIRSGFFGGNIRFASSTDSFDEKDFTFGFGGFGGWRFLRTSLFSINGQINLDLDLAFRNDDDNNNVTAALLSASPLLEFEILSNEKRDILIGVGYRFGGHSSRWTYSLETGDNSITKDAKWDNEPPKADISGLFFTFGIKFISF